MEICLNAVYDIQTQILNSIKDDCSHYKDENGIDKVNEILKLHAETCLNSLLAQHSKEYKKFHYNLVDVKGHSPEKADGLQYLEDVDLVVRSYTSTSSCIECCPFSIWIFECSNAFLFFSE